MVGAPEVVFVTRVFGERVVPFLVAALESLTLSQGLAVRTTVLLSDLDSQIREDLVQAFASVDFVPVKNLKSRPQWGHSELASNKLAEFNTYARQFNNPSTIFFFDADMLFTQPIHDLADESWDLMLTTRPGEWPLNAGLVGLRATKAGMEFLKIVQVENQRILRSARKSIKANATSGAPEQAAYEMGLRRLGIDSLRELKVRAPLSLVGSNGLRLLTVDCREYNEWNVATMSAKTRVIHFKSGWQPLLLGERGYSDSRPRELAEPLVELFWSAVGQVIERAEGPSLRALLVKARSDSKRI